MGYQDGYPHGGVSVGDRTQHGKRALQPLRRVRQRTLPDAGSHLPAGFLERDTDDLLR